MKIRRIGRERAGEVIKRRRRRSVWRIDDEAMELGQIRIQRRSMRRGGRRVGGGRRKMRATRSGGVTTSTMLLTSWCQR